MRIEGHCVEHKDFSKAKDLTRKVLIGKIFKEVSAFANTSGGCLIVGIDDKTGIENTQPDWVYDELENDKLNTSINNISDQLVVFHSYREGSLVNVVVRESEDVISVGRDTEGLHKGDCFIKENDKTIKAKGRQLRTLLEKKSISLDRRRKQLRAIVHHKYQNPAKHAKNLNVFDSLFVSVRSDKSYITTVFDNLKMNEFVFGYRLPISKYSSIQLHLDVANRMQPINRTSFEQLMTSKHDREMFFLSHRNEVESSEQLRAYLFENNHLSQGEN